MEKHASKRQDKRSGGSGWYWKDSKDSSDSMPMHQNPTPAYNPAEPALARRDDRYQYGQSLQFSRTLLTIRLLLSLSVPSCTL